MKKEINIELSTNSKKDIDNLLENILDCDFVSNVKNSDLRCRSINTCEALDLIKLGSSLLLR